MEHERRGHRFDRDAGERVVEAAVRIHYAAGLLGPERHEAMELRVLADLIHELGQRLKRGK